MVPGRRWKSNTCSIHCLQWGKWESCGQCPRCYRRPVGGGLPVAGGRLGIGTPRPPRPHVAMRSFQAANHLPHCLMPSSAATAVSHCSSPARDSNCSAPPPDWREVPDTPAKIRPARLVLRECWDHRRWGRTDGGRLCRFSRTNSRLNYLDQAGDWRVIQERLHSCFPSASELILLQAASTTNRTQGRRSLGCFM